MIEGVGVEGVKNRLLPFPPVSERQLVDHPAAESSAGHRGAVEIAGCVRNQAADRICAIAQFAFEGMNDFFLPMSLPVWPQSVGGAASEVLHTGRAAPAAPFRSSIESTGRIG